ncbi:MAG: EAL domain-containing protein [Kiloniellales bacterium]|nr:EAL domain-containing protein [Kiloniellales bacterium]
MSTTAIPNEREDEGPALPPSEAGRARTSLALVGCGQSLRDLCLALGETCGALNLNENSRQETASGDFVEPAPFDIVLLDPSAAHVGPQQLVDRLSGFDKEIGLVLVGAGTDPLLELYVEFLATHDIRVDHLLPLPTTKGALEAALAKVRNLTEDRGTPSAAKNWNAPAATTFLFQPQFSACGLEQTGAEALARALHPRLGLINPLRFPELRRDQRYLDDLFWAAIGQSLHALRNWSKAGYVGTVSVNVSAATLRQPDLTTHLSERVYAHGLHPQRIVLELVESGQIEDDPVVFDTLLGLCQEGYLLSLDDFGQGYSSLWQLSRIPFSEIKLDHRLIARLQWSDRARKLVPALIDLAHRLGIEIVAEGIEEQSQLDFVRRHRCNYVQGFLLDPNQEFGTPHNA